MGKYTWVLILKEIKGLCIYVNSHGVHIFSVRAVCKLEASRISNMCTHMSLGRTFVGSDTNIQCGPQSHLSHAWLNGTRKSADLWCNWRVRGWKMSDHIPNMVKDLELFDFFPFMTTLCLFLNLAPCWARDQRYNIRKAGKYYFWFPLLLLSPFLWCVCCLPGLVLHAGGIRMTKSQILTLWNSIFLRGSR